MTDPVFGRQATPEHGPGFWDRLDVAMTDQKPERDSEIMSVSDPSPSDDDVDLGSSVLAETSAIPAQPGPVAVELSPTGARPRRWTMVAAAAVAVLTVGVGAALLRPAATNDPSAELVVADVAEPADVAALGEGPGDGGDSAEKSGNADEATSLGAESASDVDGSTPADRGTVAADRGTGTDGTDGDTGAAGASGSAAEAAELDDATGEPPPPPLPAPGNDDAEIWPPATDLGEGSRFLATWEEQDVSWYSALDPGTDCGHARHAQIVSVNSSGLPLPIADPQPKFSGNIAHFAIDVDQRLVGFLAECDGQLELYSGVLSPESGRIDDLRLVWVGRGSSTAALVSWQGSLLALSSIADGEPFLVEADMAVPSVTGSAVLPDGSVTRGPLPVGANADGSLTWWNGAAADGASCDGRDLMVRRATGGGPGGELEPALVESENIRGGAAAIAIEQESSQLAFASECPGVNTALVYLGTLRADGLISSLRPIDLSSYGTGSVVSLHWFDANTLRIHLDSSNTGGSIQRYDWVFDQGRDTGYIVAVD